MTISLAISIDESHFLDYPTKARTGKLKVGTKFKKQKAGIHFGIPACVILILFN